MTATLRFQVASSMPVPRPVTRCSGSSVKTAVKALAAVVLPSAPPPCGDQRDTRIRERAGNLSPTATPKGFVDAHGRPARHVGGPRPDRRRLQKNRGTGLLLGDFRGSVDESPLLFDSQVGDVHAHAR